MFDKELIPATILIATILFFAGVGSYYNNKHKPYAKWFTSNKPSNVAVIKPNMNCEVWQRYNELGFKDDVIVCWPNGENT